MTITMPDHGLMKTVRVSISVVLTVCAFGCAGLVKDTDAPDTLKPTPVQDGAETDKKPADAERIEPVPGSGLPSSKQGAAPSPGVRPAQKPSKAARQKMNAEAIQKHLALAERYMNEKKYAAIPAVAEKIRRLDPDNPRAAALENEARYMAAKMLQKNHHYTEALDMLDHIRGSYKDAGAIETAIRREMKQKSDMHYKQGVRYFINEELKKAIAEWEKTLELNPGHPKAPKDIENAEHLLKELEKLN